ncbi:nuclear transport factor 2 family protein [Streptomyces sp. GQFP]|uniref:nuclear transport factor 2 family protein n=1 Tax=Streptomyces sp. GQFP TaxID=2907545 RepID=UPI001F2CF960|nr:nuclear transport factor 2 family protein [Streptomyces sp. GQFP]UIX31973.1 nuclear transport factor 2 family protein [Streptomyces sp. GQFP]
MTEDTKDTEDTMDTADTHRTRALVERFNQARAANDVEAIRGLLADDVEWHPPQSVRTRPFRGRDRVTLALTGGNTSGVLDVASIRREIVDVVVDGDRAVVRQLMTATRLDGVPYANDYCWVYTFRDGLLATLVEYGDTLLIARAGFIPLDAPPAPSPGTERTPA